MKKNEIEIILIDFLLHLYEKKLINNHDFFYVKEARKFIKTLKL